MSDWLHFRKQFVLANQLRDRPKSWQHRKLDEIHLFTHPDLEVTEKKGLSVLVLLLGYIFDPRHPTKTNDEIVSDIVSRVSSFEDLIAVLKPYAGRYALIYQDTSSFVILHDPLGLREIYYCTQPNKVICASQPNLVDAFSDPKLGITQDQGILDFYKNDLKLVRNGRLWVGDETYYNCVKHLMPNHYLDIRSLTAKRYWPNTRLEKMDLDTAVKQASEYLKGVTKAVTARYKVMMAVTSGVDSRSLLAASREVKDKIYYFVNKEPPLNEKSPDIRIPRDMFDKLNIPFHVHELTGPVDEEFRKIYLNNVFMATELLLPTVYMYFMNHEKNMSLVGVGELGRDYYGKAPYELDGYYLAHCLKYRNSKYATAQCEKWLREAKDVTEAYGVDVMRLFLWEGLLGTWGAVGSSERDIAIEEFDIYNSHYIYEIILSAEQDGTDLFKGMYREMWPDLLHFPLNPAETKMDWIKHSLKRMGLFQHLKRQRYRYDRWRFCRQTGVSRQ